MNLPVKLGTISIIDVITEFRFSNKKNIEDIFMDMYSSLKADGYTYKKLPIMELPLAIREGDQKLKYNPYYQLEKDTMNINIGPSVISFSMKGYYSGWDDYKLLILENMSKFDNILSDWGLERSSMRYINFYENDEIFDKLKININIDDNLCGMVANSKTSVYLNEFVCKDDITLKMQIAENIEIQKEGLIEKETGSMIDIDSFSYDTEKSVDNAIEELHTKVKIVFFNLLKDDFLKSLKPDYSKE
jgi:uncharacterized protein (TIGR04255 family)